MVIIWAEMMLFPVYYGYTGSDGGVGILRFIVLAMGAILVIYSAKVAVKLDIKRIPWLRFLDTAIFFWGIAVLTAWFPIDNNIFTPVAILLLLILYSSVFFIHNIAMILQQRFFLDLIPDRNRNSIYSLIPTLLLLVGAPVALIGGLLINNSGMSTTSLIIGSVGAISVIFFYLSLRVMPSKE